MSNFTSIYRAIIHDLNDPEKRGRAKLLVPAVLGRSVSGWALPVLASLPSDAIKVGEQVWVFFENGDLNRPTWLRPETTSSGVPTGASMEWHTLTPPDGWLMEDGGEYPIASFTPLYNVLTSNGTVFPRGANTNGSGGAGSTHFRTPNRKGRAPAGYDATQTEFNAIGKTGGAKTHTLTTAEMPSHTHTQDSHNHTQNSHNHTQDSHNHTQNAHSHGQDAHSHLYSLGWNEYLGVNWAIVNGADLSFNRGSGSVATSSATPGIHNATATNQATTATNQATTATNQATTATNQNTGGGGAHNNLQPYITVNYIIKT